LGRASATTGVQICAARWAKAFAILVAEKETRHSEEPRFTNGWSEIDFVRPWVERIHVWIIGFLIVGLDENHMLFTGDVSRGVGQASTARHNDVAFHLSVPVVAPGARGGEPSRDVERTRWPGVIFLPDRVVGGQQAVDGDPVVLERANVKGQHSRETYQTRWRLTSDEGARS